MSDSPDEDYERENEGKGSYNYDDDGYGPPASVEDDTTVDRDDYVDNNSYQSEIEDGWATPPEDRQELEKGQDVRVENEEGEVVEGEVATIHGSGFQVAPKEGGSWFTGTIDGLEAVESEDGENGGEASIEVAVPNLGGNAFAETAGEDAEQLRERREQALEILDETVIDDRLLEGEMGTRAISPDDDRMGGWDEFDREKVENEGSILDTDDIEGGRTALHMSVGRIETENGTFEAFIEEVTMSNEREADRGIAGWAFQREMGLRTTPHTFDEDEMVAAKRGVEGYDLVNAPESYIESIPREHAIETIAANLVGGNWDAKPENFVVDEEGQLTCIDNDWSCVDLTESRKDPYDLSDARSRMRQFNRETDVSFATSEVLGRAGDIAREMKENGSAERVVETVAQYDEEFAENVSNNIDMFASRFG